MVYFFSISPLGLRRLPGGAASFGGGASPLSPGVSAAAAWYLERGGPWRVRFIYGAHYTVDLFAVSNTASPAFLELTATLGRGALSLCALLSSCPSALRPAGSVMSVLCGGHAPVAAFCSAHLSSACLATRAGSPADREDPHPHAPGYMRWLTREHTLYLGRL